MHRSEAFAKVLQSARRRRGVALMGICNVTPDSFSDGGAYFSLENACTRVDELLAQGADIVDVGGESTRPGAAAVPASEQLQRVLDVVRYASAKAAVSIDTADPNVASKCLEAGALAINDVSCLRDEALAGIAAKESATYILMHSRGSQTDMRGFSQYPTNAYGDVVRDVLDEWQAAAERAMSRGVRRSALVMDPGLGFAKNADHSGELLCRVDEVVRGLSEVPVLIGASRKSFLTRVDPGASPMDRIGASIAAAMHSRDQGVACVRVHDVRATKQALDWGSRLQANRKNQAKNRTTETGGGA